MTPFVPMNSIAKTKKNDAFLTIMKDLNKTRDEIKANYVTLYLLQEKERVTVS